MQYSYNYFFEIKKKLLEKEKTGKHKGIRYVSNIDKQNVKLVKTFLDAGIKVRHVRNLPPMSFGVSDKEIAATIEKMEGGKKVQSLLLSNEPAYLNYFKSIFEELWKDGVDAEQRMKDIEAGADLADIEVVQSSARAREVYLNLLVSAIKEVLLVFATPSEFVRQAKLGVIKLCQEAAKERYVRTRILMPADESTAQTVQDLKQNYSEWINVRYIEQTAGTKATILLVDRKVSLVMELRDDSKATFDEAIGLSTYSNSRAGVLSYVAIFENLWKQTELYEQLKHHDIMQKEFINVAAHELKISIQPILGLTELLRSQTDDVKQKELLDVTIRNAKRLQLLTNDILDVTKIEGRSLELKKEEFNLNDVVINALNDITLGTDFLKNENIGLSYSPQNILIQGDKERISQVISNLLSNAIKFTTGGNILVSVEKVKDNNNFVILSVKDSGQGIDPSMSARLFTKFASKSHKGTGLGLFISKGIIEAHGGKIWGKNNPDGIGATFSFSLPTRQT
jgi:signal transduction histidine kinase